MNSQELQGLRSEPQTLSGSSARSPQSLEIHIHELVLHGFTPGDRHHIVDAVQRELTRLLTERGIPASLAQGGDMASLDGGAFDMPSGRRAETISAGIAQAVYGGLGR